MFFSSEQILEIQWDSNCFKDQKIVSNIQIKLEKIKSDRKSLLRSFKFFSIFSPNTSWEKVIGKITHCDIDVNEKKLSIELPPEIQKNFLEGDLLNLSISDKGWCIAIEKVKE